VNIMVTMVLGGLWHGAAWAFVFWGAYHGAGQAIGAWKRQHLPQRPETPLLILGQRVSTFALVCIGWVFFRSAAEVDPIANAFTLLGRLITGWSIPSELVNPLVVGAIALMLALQYAPRLPALRLQERISQLQPVLMGLVFAAILFVIVTLGPTGVAPFIYFQF
jgi:alginate O-acetyltransferase complex protein AlgI